MMAGEDKVFLGPTAEFPALMTSQLTSMRDNGTLTDFTITTKDVKIKLPCHKVVLAIHSPYLTAMFTTDMVEAATNTVHYDDFSLETMKLILDYCYAEQIEFFRDQLMSLITASDYLQIERLKKRCVNAVKTFLNPENVLNYLTFASDKNMKDLQNIKTWCMEVIVTSFSDVSKQPAFVGLSYEMLQGCLQECVRSEVKRDDVLFAVFTWVNENAETRGKNLEELLNGIKLDNCSLPAILDVMIRYEAMIANCKVIGLLTKHVTSHAAKIQKSPEPATAKTFLNPENVLQYLTFSGKYSLQDIKTWCLDVIVTSFSEVSMQPAFLALTYAELQDCMTEVIQSDVKCDHVLRAIFKWVNDNAESRGKHLEELLHQVPLNHCSFHTILDVMETHENMIASNVKVFRLLTRSVKLLTANLQSPTKKTLVIAGGYVDKELSPTCWRVDTKTKKIMKSFNLSVDELTKEHVMCEHPEGFVLTGGWYRDMCMLFVASTMSWQKMPKMKGKRYAHGSIYINGILYVMCGMISNSKSASVDCLTLASGHWESLPDCPIAAFWPLLAELNGKLYMLEHQETNKLHEFNVDNKEWKERAALPGVASEGASMIAVNGKLCVAGGKKSVCAWFNPNSNTWIMSEKKPSKIHCYGSLVQVDATTLLLLGDRGSADGADEIEELHIEDGAWSVKEYKMPAKLWHHKAMFLDIPQQD